MKRARLVAMLGLLVLPACAPSRTPTSVRARVNAEPAQAEAVDAVDDTPSAPLRPVELLPPDATTAARVDVPRLRELGLVEPLLALLTRRSEPETFAAACAAHASGLGEVAWSETELASKRDTFLIVAQVSTAPEALFECAERWVKMSEPIDEPGLLGRSRGSVELILRDGLVFLGEGEEVRAALARANGRRRNPSTALSARARKPEGALLVFVIEKSGVARAEIDVTRAAGDVLRLDAEFELLKADSVEQDSARLVKDLARVQEELREQLSSYFPSGTPAAIKAAIESLRSAREDARFHVRGELRLEPGLGPAVLAGVRAAPQQPVKEHVTMMAKDAAVAFELERSSAPVHRFCKSSVAVPAAVPRGFRYQPSTRQGSDFLSGDEQTGWACLRFSLQEPLSCRYRYIAGGGYLAPKRGGPSPGPKGFEVSAECDFDADGKTSLYSLAGAVGPEGVSMNPEQFVADDGE
jgi:hypothetical protein